MTPLKYIDAYERNREFPSDMCSLNSSQVLGKEVVVEMKIYNTEVKLGKRLMNLRMSEVELINTTTSSDTQENDKKPFLSYRTGLEI